MLPAIQMRSIRTRALRLGVLLMLLAPVLPASGWADETATGDLVLVLDASGSMWGQIDGENKIVIARRAVGEVVDGLDDDATVGLVAYGHRREGDCEDIETVVPLGPLDRTALETRVGGLAPKGKTPITASVEHAFSLLQGRDRGATVILVSDGLETCGGDPCAAVRAAKASGARFVMHVVGFDVGDEDVSQLECMAQAGEGRFLAAEDAAGLGQALEAALAMTAEVPAGRLVVYAVADGALQDVAIHVTDAVTGEDLGVSRTYTHADTNPRAIPLADGRYDAVIRAVGIQGDVERRFAGVEIADGGSVEKKVDFSTGELAVGVTRNGELSDATVNVYVAGTDQLAASGRTYRSASSNPKVMRVTAGRYDVAVGSVEIASGPKHRFEGVTVPPQGRSDLAHAFTSGTLKVGARRGDALVDAVLAVRGVDDDVSYGGGRTYTQASSNPKSFVLPPGTYRVRIAELRGEERHIEITVAAGETVERIVDFAAAP